MQPTWDVGYNLSSVCTTDKSVVKQKVFHLICYLRLCQLVKSKDLHYAVFTLIQLVKSKDLHYAVFTLIHQMCASSRMNTLQLISLSLLSDTMCRAYHLHEHL